MAYDRAEDLLYYVVVSSPRQSEIVSVRLDDPKAEPKSLLHGHGIKHIARDWITGNLYYAADGIGIGVCSANGKYCHHLITVPRHEEGELAQHYGDLLVHPRRGLLIWSEITQDHPTGVVMAAGLDGSKRRAIGHSPASRLKAISIDYVRDELYTLEADGLLAAFDLGTLMRHTRDMGGSAATAATAGKTITHFNGWRYFFDSYQKALVRQTVLNPREVHIISLADGEQTAITIDSDLYYERFENPCQKCSHMCVLKEVGGAAECICPDKYIRDDYSGKCIFNENSGDGPVRTSMPHAKEMCSSGEICHSALCDFKWDGSKTIACDCRAGHSGLYCEIAPSTAAMVKSASSSKVLRVMLFLLFVSLAIVVGYYCVSLHRPEWIHQAYDFFDFSGGAGYNPYRVSPFKAQQASASGGEQGGNGAQLQPREGGGASKSAGAKVSFAYPTFSQGLGSPSVATKQRSYPLVDFVSMRPSTTDSDDGHLRDLLDV